jgi:hypothetical protein
MSDIVGRLVVRDVSWGTNLLSRWQSFFILLRILRKILVLFGCPLPKKSSYSPDSLLISKEHLKSLQLLTVPQSVNMSNTENCLVEIPVESLPKLRDAYKINWPEHILAFSFLDKIIKRFIERPEQRENVKIYSIDGELNEDATFIAVVVS